RAAAVGGYHRAAGSPARTAASLFRGGTFVLGTASAHGGVGDVAAGSGCRRQPDSLPSQPEQAAPDARLHAKRERVSERIRDSLVVPLPRHPPLRLKLLRTGVPGQLRPG